MADRAITVVLERKSYFVIARGDLELDRIGQTIITAEPVAEDDQKVLGLVPLEDL